MPVLLALEKIVPVLVVLDWLASGRETSNSSQKDLFNIARVELIYLFCAFYLSFNTHRSQKQSTQSLSLLRALNINSVYRQKIWQELANQVSPLSQSLLSYLMVSQISDVFPQNLEKVGSGGTRVCKGSICIPGNISFSQFPPPPLHEWCEEKNGSSPHMRGVKKKGTKVV